MTTVTKDQLLERNEILAEDVESLMNKDENIRLNFSRSLGAGEIHKQYGENEEIVYNWYEIFREIGKLIERKDQTDLVIRCESMQNQLDDTHREIFNINDKINPSPDPTKFHI